jgi:hypothetical protein
MKRNYENEGSQLAKLIEAIQAPLRYEIECFTTTKAIWEFLEKLFGNDKELIKILMNDIKTMKPEGQRCKVDSEFGRNSSWVYSQNGGCWSI